MGIETFSFLCSEIRAAYSVPYIFHQLCISELVPYLFMWVPVSLLCNTQLCRCSMNDVARPHPADMQVTFTPWYRAWHSINTCLIWQMPCPRSAPAQLWHLLAWDIPYATFLLPSPVVVILGLQLLLFWCLKVSFHFLYICLIFFLTSIPPVPVGMMLGVDQLMDPAQLSLWVMMLWLPWGTWPWYLSSSMVSSCLTVLLIYFQCCQSLSHACNQSWQEPQRAFQKGDQPPRTPVKLESELHHEPGP